MDDLVKLADEILDREERGEDVSELQEDYAELFKMVKLPTLRELGFDKIKLNKKNA